ncbi:hypothetical protein B0H14DRAFT_3630225 [Mycena olivaceomarginata]|nr:hypothetical protein B0H14DRAFT_3630225 [Mycena olivaceomarginata]
MCPRFPVCPLSPACSPAGHFYVYHGRHLWSAHPPSHRRSPDPPLFSLFLIPFYSLVYTPLTGFHWLSLGTRLVANLPIPSLFSRPRGLCVLIFAPSPLPLFYSALSPALHLTLFSSSVLTASQIVAALLGSDHVSYHFGKGIMPKAYPLRREARAVIIDGTSTALTWQHTYSPPPNLFQLDRQFIGAPLPLAFRR